MSSMFLSTSPGWWLRDSCIWVTISRLAWWPVTDLSCPRPWVWDSGETFRCGGGKRCLLALTHSDSPLLEEKPLILGVLEVEKENM